ncbi:CAAX protease [Aureimonas ureilytica]|uniref:CAAX protease n=1 Tax=Aureimonas ureilytica TaxID=401562 RepID=A0A175R8U1_9HYPH|nr:cytochrome c oxidase assembly protein [Aureimonas ureilytica]KTQ95760.1 CAAX protease [Aureimonas ureilytica]
MTIPYCGAPPAPADLLSAWNLDPIVLALLAAAHFGGEWRLRGRSGPARLWHRLAIASLFLAFVSPLCALSSALFSVRVVHHLLLISLAAPLLALAWPQRRAFPLAGLSVLALVHVVLVWLWHAPAPYALALSHDAVYWLMELSLLGSAVVLWRGLLAPGAPLMRVLLIHLGIVAQMGLLGALITFAPDPLYAPHFLSTLPYGLSALEDQQLAGLLMWVPANLPYLLAALLALATHLRAEERAA